MVGAARNLVGPAPLCRVSHPSTSDAPFLMHAAVQGMLFSPNCGGSNGIVCLALILVSQVFFNF